MTKKYGRLNHISAEKSLRTNFRLIRMKFLSSITSYFYRKYLFGGSAMNIIIHHQLPNLNVIRLFFMAIFAHVIAGHNVSNGLSDNFQQRFLRLSKTQPPKKCYSGLIFHKTSLIFEFCPLFMKIYHQCVKIPHIKVKTRSFQEICLKAYFKFAIKEKSLLYKISDF